MNFKIKNNILLNALIKTEKAISGTKGSILSGIRFAFFKDNLILTSYNGNIVISSIVKKDFLELDNPKDFLVQGKYLINILKRYDDKDIVIFEYKDTTITIKIKKAKIKLQVLDLERFPNIKKIKFENELHLNGEDFLKKIQKVIIASSSSKMNPSLCGINIRLENKNNLFLLASDRFRIAFEMMKTQNQKEDLNIIIPASTINEILKIAEPDKEIIIRLSKTYILFSQEDWKLQSRLINSDFPELKSFFKQQLRFQEEFNKEELTNTLYKISALDSEIVKLHFEDGILRLLSKPNDLGQIEEQISILSKENFTISLSIKYLLEALSTFESEKITFIFVEELKPIILKDTTTHRHLILPTRF